MIVKQVFAAVFAALIATDAHAFTQEQCQAALKIAQNPYSTPAAQQVAVNILTGCLAAPASPAPPQAQAAPTQAAPTSFDEKNRNCVARARALGLQGMDRVYYREGCVNY
jgi:hypothetical protein